MPNKPRFGNAFTFVEILTTLVIIGVLISISVLFIGNVAEETHRTADEQTLSTLNDALNYYKSMGGDVNGLTQDVSVTYVINKLKTPISHWGTTYQFLPEGKTFSAKSIEATGYGDYLRFTRYDTYQGSSYAPTELAAVSASSTIDYLESFTPTIIRGGKSSSYEMSWGNASSWQPLGSYTPSSAGSYTFYVRNKEINQNTNTDASGPYTLTVNKISQIAVSSASATITYGESFTPSTNGGSSTGVWQVSWNSPSTWGTLSSYTPAAAGSETFYVRKAGDTNYLVSNEAGAYTLTINKAAQPTVSSANATISCGGSFTPTTAGGAGTGVWQMYWTDIGSWQSVASRTFSSTGSYTFQVRKLSDSNYNSRTSTTYTLTVNSLSQAVVSSTGGTIDYLDSFTPVVSGGSGSGAYQMSWGDNSSWESVAAYTPSSAGTEEFYVRRLNSGCYTTSDVAGPYTLTVNKLDQAVVTSADDGISCGGSFTPSTVGGSGTGAWQMYWVDLGVWETLDSRTFSSTGTYSFKVRRLGDTNYNTSSGSAIYTLTVNSVSQAAVSSANGTITYGSSFTPTTSGGSGAGAYQMSWGDTSSWESIAAHTPTGAGSETFYVRRLATGCYATSATSAAYTLTINKAAQAAVSSANGSINCGSSFTPSVSGGSGTGGWQMYWTDVGTWQTRAARTFSSSGSYTFRVRKLGDDNYNTSTQSALYTLTVNTVSQAAVSSANGTITYGSSFTPTTSGGSAGTWQMLWTDVGSWQTLAARSGLGVGSYTFRVRRAASGCYVTSSQSSLYTLTVNAAAQAAVSSANGSINCGSSFTPSVSGGSGTGGWQMYWTDIGTWQTRAARTFSSSGSYTFRVRKLGDDNYNTSTQSALYTLTVNTVSQAAVSSANATIANGASFTPSTSGGSAGTWQMYWTDVGSWQTLGSRTFSTAGSYTFRVRRLASGCYATSSQSGLYTLTVLYPAGSVSIGTSGATTSLWGKAAIYETQSINVTYSWSNMANISVKTGGWTGWRTSTSPSGSGSGANNWFGDNYVDNANIAAGNPVSRNYWYNDTRIDGTDLNGNYVSATGGYYILDQDF